MTFSDDWNRQYLAGGHMSVWPWSDVVSLVRRYVPTLGAGTRVLELGCGVGANVEFFQRSGVDYYGMDGSAAAVEIVIKRFPSLFGRVLQGDFTKRIPFTGDFDLVLDRAAVTHNAREHVRATLAEVLTRLRPGGTFIGVDWFSKLHSEFECSPTRIDTSTVIGSADGQFANVGPVHFADSEDMRELFSRFKILLLEHKVHSREVPSSSSRFASWNIVASKD